MKTSTKLWIGFASVVVAAFIAYNILALNHFKKSIERYNAMKIQNGAVINTENEEIIDTDSTLLFREVITVEQQN